MPSGVGKVSFATSLIMYFNMFAQLGIPTYGVRACAQVRDDRKKLTKVAHELLFINLIMSVLAYAVLFCLLIFVPRFWEDRVLYVVVSFTIVLTAIGMEWLYRAMEQYVYITVRSIIFKLIALLAMFMLVHEQSDYVIYGGISIFAASASNALNLINAHKFIDFKFMGGYQFKKHLRAVMVFFAMACAITVYTNLDTIMLGFMKTDVDVGYYNAAIKIKTVLLSVVTSLGVVLLPRASYYIEKGLMDEFKTISKKALNFVFVISIPLMIYFIFFAKYGILFLSGKDFIGAVLSMQIIMPTIVLVGITNILGIQVLVPLGREKVVLKSVVAGATVDLILNLLLIPSFASAGAAFGTLMAEVVVFVVQYMALRDKLGAVFRKINYFKIFIAVILSLCASIWILWMQFNTFFALMISAMCFFGVYAVVLIVLKEPLMLEILYTVKNKFGNLINWRK